MILSRDLTVQFFIKQAETTEDLNEWRSALESALAQAPSAVNTAGQHPIVSNDITEPLKLLLNNVSYVYSYKSCIYGLLVCTIKSYFLNQKES